MDGVRKFSKMKSEMESDWDISRFIFILFILICFSTNCPACANPFAPASFLSITPTGSDSATPVLVVT